MLYRLLRSVLLGLVFSSGALALYAEPASLRSVPLEKPSLEFYLLTVGLGEDPAARFGHSMVHVVDKTTGKQHTFNWGMFDFNDPQFLLNFFLGYLRYWGAEEQLPYILARYKSFEKRPVLSEKINLTAQQQQLFWRFIQQSMAGENRYFWYQYFFKNCATIPRDYLDQALQGKLKAHFEKLPASKGFRQYVRENLNKPPVVAFLLDIVMNSRLDAPISQWEEMFYPPKLRAYLIQFPSIDDEGLPRLGQPLLSGTISLVAHPDVPPSSWRLHPWFLGLGLGLLFLLLGLSFSAKATKDGLSAREVIALRLQCVPVAFWALFSGILGVVMLASWVFSAHLDLHHNANLWLFWPCDFLFLGTAFAMLRQGRQWHKPGKYLKFTAYLSYAHGLAAMVWLGACASGGIAQNCDWVIAYVAPVGLSIYGLIARWLYLRQRYFANKTCESSGLVSSSAAVG